MKKKRIKRSDKRPNRKKKIWKFVYICCSRLLAQPSVFSNKIIYRVIGTGPSLSYICSKFSLFSTRSQNYCHTLLQRLARHYIAIFAIAIKTMAHAADWRWSTLNNYIHETRSDRHRKVLTGGARKKRICTRPR